MITASTVLLSLSNSQLFMMLMSFAGMFGFTGVAIWLWTRQREARTRGPAQTRDATQTRVAASPSAPAPASPPAPSKASAEPEVTEFVALPNLREDDSPQPQPRARAAGAVNGDEPERTEFIPAPLELTGRREVQAASEEPEDRTAFVAPFGLEDAASSIAAPEPDERTAFVAPPEPDERTAFVAPPSFDRPTPTLPPTLPPAQSTPIPTPQSRDRPRPTMILDEPASPAPQSHDRPRPTMILDEPASPAPQSRDRPRPTMILAEPASPTPQSAPAPSPIPAHSPAVGASTQLHEHFELAVAALAKLEQRDDTSEATVLHGHLEVLAAVPAELLLTGLRPALLDPTPDSPRSGAAWLALFHHKSWPARRALPELLAKLPDDPRREGLRALASWDDPRAPSLAAAGLEHSARDLERRREWLELFASRGWDPGDEAVDRALSSSDPRELVAGLRLAGAQPPERVRAKVSAQLFAADPAVRIEAIETALVFGEQSAWLVCRQLARNPAFLRAAELVGLLGSAAELTQLSQAASVAGSPALLWGLGLSGRPAALEACAAALDDGDLQAAAREALALASGQNFDKSAIAHAWLSSQNAARLIAGAPRTIETLARTLATAPSLPLRQAISRELRIRGSGRVHLSAELRPRAWRGQLAELRGANIDLDRDFPWHG